MLDENSRREKRIRKILLRSRARLLVLERNEHASKNVPLRQSRQENGSLRVLGAHSEITCFGLSAIDAVGI